MKKKEFKAESKKLLDLMINSVYTNKEIFLRELISNASDAIDKLYYNSLTDKSIKVNHKDLSIKIELDKNTRQLRIIDNGCGMSKDELEDNLGTICKSGSEIFKKENEHKKDIDIIGQFGVGFYSSFMVSDTVKVTSKKVGSSASYTWVSNGLDGYTIEETEKESVGTTVELTLKEDTEDENYSNYLNDYTIKELVKKYSDYITYPIKMEITHEHLKEGSKDEYEKHTEIETLNSLIPIWKKDKKKTSDEEYNNFYTEKFSDYESPAERINIHAEGLVTYDGLLFIPSHPSYDYYTKEYEKGLQLYSNGVLIMDKCADLLPDYFSFVKGIVDSPDLQLNISRETLQQSRTIKTIAKNVETKIIKTLEELRDNNREKYEHIYENFGVQIKYGIYSSYGMNNELLKDLLLFHSSSEKKLITLKEYLTKLKENQDKIYYATGDTIDKIDTLPQVESFKEKGYEILYFKDYVDEFTVQTLREFEGKTFINVSKNDATLDTEEEKEELKRENENAKEIFDFMKEEIKEVKDIRFTHRLKNHPVCLTNEGELSIGMEKTLNTFTKDQKVKSEVILEINESHPIADKIKELYANDKEALKKYSKVLYSQARLIEGLEIENPTEISNIICDILSK